MIRDMCAGGIVVSIAAYQAVGPVSILGRRNVSILSTTYHHMQQKAGCYYNISASAHKHNGSEDDQHKYANITVARTCTKHKRKLNKRCLFPSCACAYAFVE